MHNDLAWAVLEVEPTIGAMIEAAARQQRIATGKFLEQLMTGAQQAAAERVAGSTRNQRLSDLFSSMAESLMAAGDLVNEESSASASDAITPGRLKTEPLDNTVQLPARAENSEHPVLAPEDEVASRPSAEQLQAWMRVAGESNAPKVSPARMFGRSLLQRSA